ncbi:NHL repeat-containing protein [Dyella sp. C11]|uniref:NHL repeat-containing protein n=1 Tax=Dyella sp. C11 TaxID=2126991 RepID=UPI0018E50098|nr:NHL repeat-containing protein [Dyella sp. C11]
MWRIRTSLGVIAVAMSFLCRAGQLPIPPDELKYPNVVKSTLEYKSWGLGPQDLNDPFTCRHMPDGRLLISDFENHQLKIFDFTSSRLSNVSLRTSKGVPMTGLLPFAALMTSDNHVLLVDRSEGSLLEFGSDGRLLRQFGANDPSQRLFEGGKIALNGDRVAVADEGHNRVLVYARNGKLLVSLGSYGQHDGEFNGPQSVAFTRNGDLLVLDTYNNRVQVFGPDYQHRATWGRWGSFKGFMANPSDIYVDQNDDVYVTDLLNHRVQVFRPDGTFKLQFGRHPPTSHEGNGRIHYPTSVSVSDRDQSIVTCEPFESRLQRFSLGSVSQVKNVNDSAWWEKGARFHYGSKATAAGSMLAISEPDTHAILFFHLDGTTPILTEIIGGEGSNPGQFVRPAGLAVDAVGLRLLVSDSGNHRIQEFKIDADGISQSLALSKSKNGLATADLSATFNSAPAAPHSLRFVASHEIRFATTSTSKSLQTRDEPQQTSNAALEPSAIKVGPDNLIYVADPEAGRVLVLSNDYQLLRVIQGTKKTGAMSNPLDFSFSRDGHFIFVVDHYNYRVLKFTVEGAFVAQIGGPGPQPGRFVLPFGIQSGQDGFVYVSDVGGQRIVKFTEDGHFVKQWGRWGTAPGEFYKPKGLAQLADNTLVVVDFGNHRAQMFDPEGRFLRTFGIENAVTSAVRP